MTLVKIKARDIPSSEITPEDVYHSRRRILQSAGIVAAGTAIPAWALPTTWLGERKFVRTMALEGEEITEEDLAMSV